MRVVAVAAARTVELGPGDVRERRDRPEAVRARKLTDTSTGSALSDLSRAASAFLFQLPGAPFCRPTSAQHRSLKQRPSGRQWWAAGHVSENIDGTRHVVGPSGAVLMSWAPWVQPLAGAAPSCVVDIRSPRPVVGQLARPPSKFPAEGGSTTSQTAGIRTKC